MRDVRAYEARTQRLAVWVCLLVVLLLLEPARSIVLRWLRTARQHRLDKLLHPAPAPEPPPAPPTGAVRVPGGGVWALPEPSIKPGRVPRKRGTER